MKMGFNFKLSFRGKMLMKAIKPIGQLIYLGVVLFSIIWSIVQGYSFLKGILFLIGMQVGFGFVYAVFLYIFMYIKESQWRKEDMKRFIEQ